MIHCSLQIETNKQTDILMIINYKLDTEIMLYKLGELRKYLLLLLEIKSCGLSGNRMGKEEEILFHQRSQTTRIRVTVTKP